MKNKNTLTIEQFVKKFFVEKNVDRERAEAFYKEYVYYEKNNVSFEVFKSLLSGKS